MLNLLLNNNMKLCPNVIGRSNRIAKTPLDKS